MAPGSPPARKTIVWSGVGVAGALLGVVLVAIGAEADKPELPLYVPTAASALTSTTATVDDGRATLQVCLPDGYELRAPVSVDGPSPHSAKLLTGGCVSWAADPGQYDVALDDEYVLERPCISEDDGIRQILVTRPQMKREAPVGEPVWTNVTAGETTRVDFLIDAMCFRAEEKPRQRDAA